MALYRVTGRSVRGNARGAVVSLSLSPRLERHYVESGDLEIVSAEVDAPDETEDDQTSVVVADDPGDDDEHAPAVPTWFGDDKE